MESIVQIGAEFGRLTVLGLSRQDKCRFWLCVCECGEFKVAREDHLRTGATTSCGCFRLQRVREAKTTHGHAKKGHRSLTYSTYRAMLTRCLSRSNPKYPDYGGRGITVCERWRESFENFLADMGEKPSPQHSIERKDVNGPYTPENCCWATAKEQARNQRTNRLITFRGETRCLSEWAEITGIEPDTIAARLKVGKTVEDALTALVQPFGPRYSKRS